MRKLLPLIALVGLTCLGTLGVQTYLSYSAKVRQERQALEARKAAWLGLRDELRAEIKRFPGDAGIVVKDLETGWELHHQKTRRFPSASLAKLPLMAACLVAAERGRLDLDQELTLRAADKLEGSGALKDAPAGATYSVGRLIGLMIYDSDNTATNLLTRHVGLEALNQAFESFGLSQTRLSRRIADYRPRDEKGIENYTTADEMALLLEKIYRKRLGGASVSERCVATLKLSRNNDRIPRHLPAEVTVAHKTGLENGVCHDVGIVYTPGGDLIVAVLTQHDNGGSGPSKDFIARVARRAYEYLTVSGGKGSTHPQL